MLLDETAKVWTLSANPFIRSEQIGCRWSLQNDSDDELDNEEEFQAPELTIATNQPFPNRSLAVADQLQLTSLKCKVKAKEIHKIAIMTLSKQDALTQAYAAEMIFLCGLLICKLTPNTVQWKKIT